jgi:hypothetical protein
MKWIRRPEFSFEIGKRHVSQTLSKTQIRTEWRGEHGKQIQHGVCVRYVRDTDNDHKLFEFLTRLSDKCFVCLSISSPLFEVIGIPRKKGCRPRQCLSM